MKWSVSKNILPLVVAKKLSRHHLHQVGVFTNLLRVTQGKQIYRQSIGENTGWGQEKNSPVIERVTGKGDESTNAK